MQVNTSQTQDCIVYATKMIWEANPKTKSIQWKMHLLCQMRS